jgi:peptidyl-prolyl cis-trans isomerase C
MMAPRPPVKVNGVAIAPSIIAEEAQHHPARTPREAFQAAARALAVRALLLDEAKRRNIPAEPALLAAGKRETEDEARVRALIACVVTARDADDEECRAFYAANAARFASPDLFEASHILFAASPRDQAAYAAAVARATATIAELQEAPQRFEEIARTQSDCESRANGGRLGQTPSGSLVPEVETALATLREGEIASAAVKSRYGAHVLRLDRRAAGEPLPFAYVHERIAAYLGERNWRRDVAQFIDGLVGAAAIEGVDMNPGAKAA